MLLVRWRVWGFSAQQKFIASRSNSPAVATQHYALTINWDADLQRDWAGWKRG